VGLLDPEKPQPPPPGPFDELELQVAKPRCDQSLFADIPVQEWNIETSFFAPTIFLEELERPLFSAFECDWSCSRVPGMAEAIDARLVGRMREVFWLFYEPIVLLYLGFCSVDPSGESTTLGITSWTATAFAVKHGVMGVVESVGLELADIDACFSAAAAVEDAPWLEDACKGHMLQRHDFFEFLLRVAIAVHPDARNPFQALTTLLEQNVQADMDDYIRAYTTWRTESVQTQEVETVCRENVTLMRKWFGDDDSFGPKEWMAFCESKGLLQNDVQQIAWWEQIWCFKFAQIPHSTELTRPDFRVLHLPEFAECLGRAILLDKCPIDWNSPSDPTARFAYGAIFDPAGIAEAMREFFQGHAND